VAREPGVSRLCTERFSQWRI